jgi:hypothetical protein
MVSNIFHAFFIYRLLFYSPELYMPQKMSPLSQVTLHIGHVPTHYGKVTVLCNVHGDSVVEIHTEMYTDNTGQWHT